MVGGLITSVQTRDNADAERIKAAPNTEYGLIIQINYFGQHNGCLTQTSAQIPILGPGKICQGQTVRAIPYRDTNRTGHDSRIQDDRAVLRDVVKSSRMLHSVVLAGLPEQKAAHLKHTCDGKQRHCGVDRQEALILAS